MNETRIVDLRTQMGWTQERLADESGVTVRTVQRLEAGNDGSLDTLSRVAKAFGVPVRDLFGKKIRARLPLLPRRVLLPAVENHRPN